MTFSHHKAEQTANMAALDATLADLSRPLPWFEGDLNEANAKGLKPTCDEAGNWRYVPAAEIDGPRVPAHRAEAARAERFLASVAEHNATASPERRIVTPDDVARAAVEGVAA